MYMQKVKNPTGPITPRRFSNGLFLMTVFADSQRYPDMHGFEMRDPYWLVAGWEGTEQLGGRSRRTILWSQPEILLYALPPCEDSRCGIGYPDFIETATGEIFLTETDKKDSRVHRLPPDMLEKMWAQRTVNTRAAKGLVLSLPKTPAPTAAAGTVAPLPANVLAPKFGNLSAGAGFALELVLDTAALPRATLSKVPLLDCRAPGAALPQTRAICHVESERTADSFPSPCL